MSFCQRVHEKRERFPLTMAAAEDMIHEVMPVTDSGKPSRSHAFTFVQRQADNEDKPSSSLDSRVNDPARRQPGLPPKRRSSPASASELGLLPVPGFGRPFRAGTRPSNVDFVFWLSPPFSCLTPARYLNCTFPPGSPAGRAPGDP